MVAAAGNENNDLTTPNSFYPAQANYVIAVGATNKSDQRCDENYDTCLWEHTPRGSGHGEDLDIMAPGAFTILTTDLTGPSVFDSGDYAIVGGTSVAAPFVSGLAGLILSVNPNLSPDDVEQKIKERALLMLGIQTITVRDELMRSRPSLGRFLWRQSNNLRAPQLRL